MKVLITFLFLGFCLFGLGSSLEVTPKITMDNNHFTYKVTCGSTKATHEIRYCRSKKYVDEQRNFVEKKRWNETWEDPEDSTSDKYFKMVTSPSIVDNACQATFISHIYAKEHTGMSL